MLVWLLAVQGPVSIAVLAADGGRHVGAGNARQQVVGVSLTALACCGSRRGRYAGRRITAARCLPWFAGRAASFGLLEVSARMAIPVEVVATIAARAEPRRHDALPPRIG